jgi:hypothetical protein
MGDGPRSASSMAGVGAMVRRPSADKTPWCSPSNALWPLMTEAREPEGTVGE